MGFLKGDKGGRREGTTGCGVRLGKGVTKKTLDIMSYIEEKGFLKGRQGREAVSEKEEA